MKNLKPQFKNKNRTVRFALLVVVFSFSLFAFSFISYADAARFYLAPSGGEYSGGDTFLVQVKLDTERVNINAVEAALRFPQDILEVKDISRGNSTLTLWIREPAFSNESGTIFLTGGVPGGYHGPQGLLATVAFRVKEQTVASEAVISFDEISTALLNDGFGTKAQLVLESARYAIGAGSPVLPSDQLRELLEKDKTPPLDFQIITSNDPAIFDGRNFIAFSTTDKESGIDHYEVQEGDGEWKRAESPYLLELQDSRKPIRVRAIDKAGNVREAETRLPYRLSIFDVTIMLLILVVLFAILFIMSKHKRRKTGRKRRKITKSSPK